MPDWGVSEIELKHLWKVYLYGEWDTEENEELDDRNTVDKVLHSTAESAWRQAPR